MKDECTSSDYSGKAATHQYHKRPTPVRFVWGITEYMGAQKQ